MLKWESFANRIHLEQINEPPIIFECHQFHHCVEHSIDEQSKQPQGHPKYCHVYDLSDSAYQEVCDTDLAGGCYWFVQSD